MKRLLIAGLAITGGSLWVGELGAHGGTYRGPGDTVPPGAGGGGGGGPATGAPSGPATGGPSGPTTPGPTVPGQTGGTSAGAGTTTTTGVDVGPDLTAWSFWWEFNKEPFINLKAAIRSEVTTTGSGDFFLGQGETEQASDTLRPTTQQIRGQIVPALLSALEKETNNDIVTGCLIALAKIGEESAESGDNAFEKTISGFLKDGSQEISETAALSLGILASDNSIDLLEALARDSKLGQDAVGSTEVDPRSQAFAAYGLGLLGNRTGDPAVRSRVVAILTDLLPKAETMSRQDLAVACVISLGLTPLDPAPAATDADAEVSKDPTASLQAQIDFLLEFMLDENKNYMPRAHVPTAVARLMTGLNDEVYRQRIVDAILLPVDARKGKKFVQEVRQSCALALGLIGDADDDAIDVEIRNVLLKDVQGYQSQTRKFGLMSMAKVAARPGSGAKDLDKNRRELTDELVKNLRNSGGEDQWAIMALGVYGYTLGKNEEVPPASLSLQIRDSLGKAKSPDDIGAASVAAGLFGDPEAQETLLKLLGSTRDPVAQGYVALGLGMLNQKEAIQPIQEVLAEAEYKPELLQQAAIALGLLGSKETVGTLIDMLENAGSLASQAAAASALGFIGDRNSVEPLVEMLEDGDITDTARGFAAVALGIVADKEELPWNSKIAVDLNYRASTSTLNTLDGKGVLNIL
ncbi:HEAT repeat domain-containing protein [Engelhardtia mirabilis]|uniref:PBS lyase HEAT-like repeat protein n=1 Tax=Engelhardtia mirabilis TaxID=2528011 RepID=A0A518BKP9_9BACT|nr:PBS lyase HEAT-like repeat protein [Planctomycetes bacterium Pla133]QDV01876.1 PBS lyase HEAT-like repeat protein [Planctomycetes bacterium Pla86]